MKKSFEKRNISYKSCYVFDINVLTSIIYQNSIKVLLLSELCCFCSTFYFNYFFATKRRFFSPVIMIFTANNVYFKFRYSFYVNIEISITCQTVWIFILFFWNRKKNVLFLFFCVKFILFSKFNFHKLNWKRRDLFILQCMIVNLKMKNVFGIIFAMNSECDVLRYLNL